MEAIRETARETVSGLKETLIADTVDFIVNTSLQILPLAYRDDKKALVNKIGRRRIMRFNMLMQRIVSSFVNDDEEFLELYQNMLISVLGKNDEDLVTKFRQLMQAWKSDKADPVATLIDQEESAIEDLKSLKISEKEALNTKQLLGSQKIQKMSGMAKTLANTLVKTTTTLSSRNCGNMPSENQNTELLNPSVTHQKPCESNAYGVETGDGVLVGHPPPYPPGLLDWESPEDNEEFEELVSNRQARIRAQAPMNNGGSKASHGEDGSNSTRSVGHNSDSDDEWICL